MHSKRLRAMVIAIVFVLSVVGPCFSGVWSQLQDVAVCNAGWEWVCSFKALHLRLC